LDDQHHGGLHQGYLHTYPQFVHVIVGNEPSAVRDS